MFNFKLDKINFQEELGSGVSGCIYPYQKSPEDKKWVVKYTRATNINELLKVLPEIVLGFACNHPSILPINGYHIEKSHPTGFDIYFKLPRMVKSLKDYIKQKRREQNHFSEEIIVKYFYTMVCGIEYMHRRKIAHRDIKPSNILVDSNDKIQISDVGIAKFVADDETSCILTEREGTYQYSAPEILNRNQSLKKRDLYKADVWSLGMTLSELCLLELKWINFVSSTPNADPESEIQSIIEKIEKLYSQPLAKLVYQMLSLDPAKRLSIEEVRVKLEQDYKNILVKFRNEILSYNKIGFSRIQDIEATRELSRIHQY